MNAPNNLNVILASTLIMIQWNHSFVLGIRTPYFATGKFAERDVDIGIRSKSHTLSNVRRIEYLFFSSSRETQQNHDSK